MTEQPGTPPAEPFQTADAAGSQIVGPIREADVVSAVRSLPAADAGDGEEIVDAYPVLAEVRPLPATAPVALPAVQAAAAAAAGFVAGAATLALCRRLGAFRLRPTRVAHGRGVDLPIVGTRTFLVDVHLIAKPGE